MTRRNLQSLMLDRLRSRTAVVALQHPDAMAAAHKACLRIAGQMKAGSIVSSRAQQQRFAANVRRELGLGGMISQWLASILGNMAKQILLQILADLIPAFIQWLQEQFNDLVQHPAADGGSPLDAMCLRLAEEA